jgi:hypothetical protein
MKLLTKELRTKIPPLYSQEGVEGTDQVIRAKFFHPASQWTWYVIEGEERDGDFLFFGWVNGHELELGYFVLSELESVKSPYGLGIERDLHFTPATWSVVKEKEHVLRGRL